MQCSSSKHSEPASGLKPMQYRLPSRSPQYCRRDESLNGTQSWSRSQGTAHRLKPSPVSRQSPAQQSSAVVQRAPGNVGMQTFAEARPDTVRQQA